METWNICVICGFIHLSNRMLKSSPEMLSKHLEFMQQQNVQKLSVLICFENKHLETLKKVNVFALLQVQVD